MKYYLLLYVLFVGCASAPVNITEPSCECLPCIEASFCTTDAECEKMFGAEENPAQYYNPKANYPAENSGVIRPFHPEEDYAQ